MKIKNKGESIKLFALPFIPGAEAISGQYINNDFRQHIHKTYIIGIVKRGKRIITHSDGVAQISENEVFIINPGQVHSCSSGGRSGHSYKILSVSLQAMQSIASQISEKYETRPYFKNVLYKNTMLSKTLARLFNVIEKPGSNTRIEKNIYSFLACLLTYFSEPPPTTCAAGEQRDSIKRACDYICNNYKKNLSLRELAEIACLSPFHFQREFKKSMGITPREYLSDLRISESKKMLLRMEDIAATANQLSFFDQSHFSRTFRKTVGISPGKYCKINALR